MEWEGVFKPLNGPAHTFWSMYISKMDKCTDKILILFFAVTNYPLQIWWHPESVWERGLLDESSYRKELFIVWSFGPNIL